MQGDKLTIPFFWLSQVLRSNRKEHPHPIPIIDQMNVIKGFDFQPVILEQSLVYMVGIIESYICDSARIIYSNMPKYLNAHDLSLIFSELTEFDSLDAMKEVMLQKAMGRTWSQGSFSNRIDKLRKKFSIILNFKAYLKELLDEANLLRNCILHNGSKVSEDYLKEFGEKRTLELNSLIMISPYFIDAIFYLGLDLIKLLFIETSGKAWEPSKKINAELFSESFGCAVYFKDAVTQKDNWIYKELHEHGVL